MQLAASGSALLLVVGPCGPLGAPISPILRWLRGLDRSGRLHIFVFCTRNRQLSLVLCLVLADTHCEIRAHWLLHRIGALVIDCSASRCMDPVAIPSFL